MISWKRTNQGGALRTFLIVAVLLALVTILAINFVHDRGEQARRNQAIAQANDQAAADKAVSAPGTESSGDQTGKSSGSSASETPQTSTVQASDLPVTGPTDLAEYFVTLGLLTGSLTAYVSSRRILKRPL